MAEFVIEKTEGVEFDYWYTSSSNRALDFLEDFESFLPKLENVTFTPRFVFWACQTCDPSYL